MQIHLSEMAVVRKCSTNFLFRACFKMNTGDPSLAKIMLVFGVILALFARSLAAGPQNLLPRAMEPVAIDGSWAGCTAVQL